MIQQGKVHTMRQYHRIRCLVLFILLIPLMPALAHAESLTCTYLPHVMDEFLDNHYAIREIDDVIRAHTVDQMVKHLDSIKILLYAEDVVKIRQDLMGMFAVLEEKNCIALQKVYDVLLVRAKENEQFVKKFLGADYKLDDTVELDTDLEKRPYPETQAEKEELLRKFVHFQIANALLAGQNLDEAKKHQIHRHELQIRRLRERGAEHLVTSFAEAFALALDPHSSYMSAEAMEDFHIQMKLSLEGIGAVLSNEDGFTLIEELIPGGGAERTGLLKPKDKIIAVTQDGEEPVNVIDMDLREVIKMIRGRKGTKVTLMVLRQADHTKHFEVIDVTIVRDKINIKEQEAKLTYEKRRAGSKNYVFGIIDLPSFYGGDRGDKSCYEDVKCLLRKAEEKKVDGIILNLSRNTGGLVEDAVRITGLFLDKGGVVAMKNKNNYVNILANGLFPQYNPKEKRSTVSYPEEDKDTIYSGPLVVFTSRLSASASEIVAGALKDYHRAVIIGADHTFGKGSIQKVKQLPRGLGGFGVTSGLYFLPGGTSTQQSGVAADIVLPGLFSSEEFGESALDYPLPTQVIAPFVYKPIKSQSSYPSWRPVDASLIARLANNSAARTAKDESFLKIIKTNKDTAEKPHIVRISDLRKENEKGTPAKKPREELRKKAMDQDTLYLTEGINILLDMITMQSVAANPASIH